MARLHKIEMYVADKHSSTSEVVEAINYAINRTSLQAYTNGTKIVETVSFDWRHGCVMDNAVITWNEIEAFAWENKEFNKVVEESKGTVENKIKRVLEAGGVAANPRNIAAFISRLNIGNED